MTEKNFIHPANIGVYASVSALLDSTKAKLLSIVGNHTSNEHFTDGLLTALHLYEFEFKNFRNKIEKEQEPNLTPKPKQKLITWYRPKYGFSQAYSRPETFFEFYKSKEEFYEKRKDVKVLNDEWETIEAPEYFKDW